MLRPLVLAVFLVGCGGDADGDGLSNKEEKELGTNLDKADTDGDGLSDKSELDGASDPLNADSDDDGLNDGEEADLGSDPNAVDSDADTYLDFDEVQEGSDPADADSRIYKGYWPYNANRESVDLEAWDGSSLEIGDKFGRFADGKDQFRDNVDIRDFAQRGRYIVVDASATWCGPCQAMSSWLSEGAKNDPYGYEAEFKKVRTSINNDELTWVTFMTDNDVGGEIVFADVKDWDTLFPNEMIPVITDVEQRILAAVNQDGNTLYWPSFVVLDENLEVAYRGGGADTLYFLLEVL